MSQEVILEFMNERCLNCRSRGAEKRDLTARQNQPDEVYLCESCYAALEAEFVWGDGATSE